MATAATAAVKLASSSAKTAADETSKKQIACASILLCRVPVKLPALPPPSHSPPHFYIYTLFLGVGATAAHHRSTRFVFVATFFALLMLSPSTLYSPVHLASARLNSLLIGSNFLFTALLHLLFRLPLSLSFQKDS